MMLKDSHRSPEANKAAIVAVNLRLSVSVPHGVATVTVAATAVATITIIKAMSICWSILRSCDPNSIVTMSAATDGEHEERDPSCLHVEKDASGFISKTTEDLLLNRIMFSKEQKPDPL